MGASKTKEKGVIQVSHFSVDGNKTKRAIIDGEIPFETRGGQRGSLL